MKKVFAIFVSMIFFASLSIAVFGCKEAPKQEAAPKVEAPAAPAARCSGTSSCTRSTRSTCPRESNSAIYSQEKQIGHPLFIEWMPDFFI